MALNPEFKKEWVDALRSGEYTQARGALSSIQGYCCLGVRCELDAVKGLLIKLPSGTRSSFSEPGHDGSYNTGYPPEAARERWGLSREEMYDLARMNDSYKTFDEIATWIEENL